MKHKLVMSGDGYARLLGVDSAEPGIQVPGANPRSNTRRDLRLISEMHQYNVHIAPGLNAKLDFN